MKTRENEERLQKTVSRCTFRIRKLVKMEAPTPIVCGEVALLLQKMLALHPEDMGLALGMVLGSSLRNWHNICEECGADLESETGWECQTCLPTDEEMDQMEHEEDS